MSTSSNRPALTEAELLDELAPAVDKEYHRHISDAEDWQPQDLVPWSKGRTFAFLGGEDWSADQAHLTDAERVAMQVGVLIADNLPAYHREISTRISRGPWWTWLGRWTAEENRHAIVMRDYLVVTRSVDPVELERLRMSHMTEGYRLPQFGILELLAACLYEEFSAVERHTNAAALATDPHVQAIFERVAQDDKLQAEFYINLLNIALDLVPGQAMQALADRIDGFAVPEVALPGGLSSTDELSRAGIYDPTQQNEKVFAAALRGLKIAERDVDSDAEAAKSKLLAILGG